MKLLFRLALYSFVPLIIITHACQQKVGVLEEDLSGKPGIEKVSIAISKDLDNPDLYHKRAVLYYDSQEYDRAIADLEDALGHDSTHLDSHHLLADVYMDYYQSQKALMTMERAAALYPDTMRTLLKLSEFQLILRQHDRSMETISKVLNKDPQNAEALFMLGMNFKEKGELENAIGAFQSAVEIDPDIIDAWIILGDLMGRLNNPIAIQYFNNALSLDSNNISALHSKAFYLQNGEQIDEALRLYAKINEIDPLYPDAYLNAALLHLHRNDITIARETLNEMLTIDSANAVAYYYRGVINEQMGEYDSALADYARASRLDARNQRIENAYNILKAKMDAEQ